MGQAKQRGTYEQRKAEAEERARHKRMVKEYLGQRRPSPKHVAFMSIIAAISQGKAWLES
jgi:hypothetical protein